GRCAGTSDVGRPSVPSSRLTAARPGVRCLPWAQAARCALRRLTLGRCAIGEAAVPACGEAVSHPARVPLPPLLPVAVPRPLAQLDHGPRAAFGTAFLGRLDLGGEVHGAAAEFGTAVPNR